VRRSLTYMRLRHWWFMFRATRLFPSQAQRDWDSGDPTRRARVEALAARVREELEHGGRQVRYNDHRTRIEGPWCVWSGKAVTAPSSDCDGYCPAMCPASRVIEDDAP
jgi:hypothetical protein